MATAQTLQASSLGSPESIPGKWHRNGHYAEYRQSYTQKTPNRAHVGFSALPSSSPWHRDEARCVLQDINNFIALGCLTSGQHLDNHDDASDWTEMHRVPESLGLALHRDLNSLTSAGWIRIFASCGRSKLFPTTLRIYVLAGDVGHRSIERSDKDAKGYFSSLRDVALAVDPSPALWQCKDSGYQTSRFDLWATPDSKSLFWMFNNIPSPNPSTTRITNTFRRRALAGLLDQSSCVAGLRTKLYPYQCRSVGLMLQRESESRLFLDPRLEQRTAPDGSMYYYSARDFHFLKQPRKYEAVKGGILAETMGLGKTVIALALILSTRGCLPKVPVEYEEQKQRFNTASLMDMCVSAAHRHSIPWKAFFDRMAAEGESMTECVSRLQQSKLSYEIPQIPPRFNRTTIIPPPKVKSMASTTIVVVPRNLCSQWQSELEKHVEAGILNVLIMEDLKKALPPPDDLRQYDLVLFSRNRFEQESRDGSDEQGRRFSKTPLGCNCPYIGATRTRDCTCLRRDDLYDSPLKQLHFLRIIIDEGHSFSSHTSMAAHVAEKLVTADHRWVVSGTPAKDLLGVEMDLYSSEQSPMALNDEVQRATILDQRKDFNANEDSQGAVKSIGSLMTHFLQIKPWSGGQGERVALWEEYIYRHEDFRKKSFSSFSKALRQSLEAVVIKTRPEDVERDIELPPLTHDVIKLEPSYYDKVTANLFTFVLTANAVTSERTDRDYLFHKESAKARYQLISNLRQSAFFWTGFSEADITNTIGNCERYLEKDNTSCTAEDRKILQDCIDMARAVLDSPGWKNLSATHEIGLSIKDWPEESAEHWSFDGTKPMLTGATQMADAQNYVHSRLMKEELDLNLAGEGIKAMSRARARGREETKAAEATSKNALVKSGVPSSSVNGEPTKKRASPTKKRSAKEAFSQDSDIVEDQPDSRKRRKTSTPSSPSVSPTDPHPLLSPATPPPSLPPSHPLASTTLTGTVSAKTSHLLSRILALHATEKILVFYTGDNAAYYLAQCLEILHVPHLIYARSLPAATKSSYIVQFNDSERVRVLLMDVGQAAFGLNLSSASRVFFLNPVCRPGVEAQAIKRAHRIGQTREVKVETLVLRGTVEEGLWKRARGMSWREHREAKVLEDDGGVVEVVQGARLLPLEEGEGVERVAKLETPQKVFCREGWRETVEKGKEAKEGRGGKRKGSSAGSGASVDGERPRKRKKIVGFAAAAAGGPNDGPPSAGPVVTTSQAVAGSDVRQAETHTGAQSIVTALKLPVKVETPARSLFGG